MLVIDYASPWRCWFMTYSTPWPEVLAVGAGLADPAAAAAFLWVSRRVSWKAPGGLDVRSIRWTTSHQRQATNDGATPPDTKKGSREG